MKIVFFAGGVGTRLWPLSRKNSPKQFEKILGEKSTLQLAVERLRPDFPWEDMYISTGKKYVDVVQNQLDHIPSQQIIGEPMMRDVGPAVGLMAAILAKNFPNEPIAILWSDHLVKQEEHFRKILKTAGELIAENPNKIIFVAQKPRFASENLGWIDYGNKVFERNDVSVHAFTKLTYRPSKENAAKYFASGHHGWNLGYFVTTPAFLLEQYKKFVPQVYEQLLQIAESWQKPEFNDVLDKVYPTIDKISFDNAVLEHITTENAYVICENIEWSDIGAWEALKEAMAPNQDDNLTQGNVMVRDSRDSLLFNYTKQLVVGIDLNEFLVINTEDVVLICPKTSVAKIKKLVESLAGTEHEHLT